MTDPSSSSSLSSKIVESVSSKDVVPTITTETNVESAKHFLLARVLKEGRTTLFLRKQIPAEIEATTFEFKRRGGDKHELLLWPTDTDEDNMRRNGVSLDLVKCEILSVGRTSVSRGVRIVLKSHEPFRLPRSKWHETTTTISITKNHNSSDKELEFFLERLVDAVERSKASDWTDLSVRYEDFDLGKEIGRGACGIVFRARWVKKKIVVAVKKMLKEKIDHRELLALKKLKHSNIPRYYGVFERDEGEDAQVYLVMELCDRGNLKKLLGVRDIVALCRERAHESPSRAPTSGPWTDRFFRQTLLGIVDGMVQMHHLGFAHRDLKSENVMLHGPDYVVKIADFGTVKREEFGDGVAALRNVTGQKGTKEYIPWMDYQTREMGRGCLAHPKKHDVYSFGVMVWEMYTRVKPYSWYANWYDAQQDIAKKTARLITSNTDSISTTPTKNIPSTLEWPKEVTIDWVRWPNALQILVNACTDVDLTKRPSFGKIKTFLMNDTVVAALRRGNGWWREVSNESDAPDSSATKETERDDKVARAGDENAERYNAACADLVSAAHAATKEAEDDGDIFASPVRYEDLGPMTEIGGGTFGCVFRARYKKKLDVAVKIVPKEKVNRFELLGLQELTHSNIVRYYGTFERDDEWGGAQVYLVMELCDRGDLKKLLGAKDIVTLCRERAHESPSRAPASGPWTDRFFRQTLLGIVDGMVQMHHLGFAHRDLKPENVMLRGPDYVVKITDFGIVEREEFGDDDAALRTVVFGGTPLYMPWMDYQTREMGLGCLAHPKKHDVYSFGVMVWEMYTRVKPFSWYTNWYGAQQDIEKKTARLITSNAKSIRMRPNEISKPSSLQWPKEVTMDWVRWPHALRDLVDACTYPDLTKRPPFKE
eukprot:g5381.t1